MSACVSWCRQLIRNNFEEARDIGTEGMACICLLGGVIVSLLCCALGRLSHVGRGCAPHLPIRRCGLLD
eukprot:scaffold434_cov186-Pinguiococcus_pyrenoidosus.AAC.91